MNNQNNIGHIKTERITIDKLVPADYNPRDMSDKAREGLSNSINSFGLMQPIVWNKQTGNIVGGHQRLYDLISKGALETDVIVVDFPLAKEKAANIALNHTSITGTYDTDKLQELLSDIGEDLKESLLLTDLELPDWDPPKEKEIKEYDEEKDLFFIKIPDIAPDDKESILVIVNEALKGSGYLANAY